MGFWKHVTEILSSVQNLYFEFKCFNFLDFSFKSHISSQLNEDEINAFFASSPDFLQDAGMVVTSL